MSDSPMAARRAWLRAAGATGLAGLGLDRAAALDFAPPRSAAAPAAVRASAERLIDIAVCTRPFRPQGPRLEAELRHGKHLVHHYGHGGAGWSLSWGSAREVLPLIQAGTRAPRERVAIIGAGAIGLTTARVAQRAGLRVRIYARELPPEVASSAAAGMWSPESRFCSEDHATPALQARWERMARYSFRHWQSLLGLAGEPVAWHEGYVLADVPFGTPLPPGSFIAPEGEPDYPDLMARLPELRLRGEALAPGEHPFKVAHARRFNTLVFNLASYQRLLLDDFLREGGELQPRAFEHQRQIAGLPERVVVNCCGYGARALFGAEELVPVKGQTARLLPQPEVDYALIYRGHNLLMLPRRDGLLLAAQGEHDFGNADPTPDRAQTLAAVERLASLYR